ncbi:MAG: hypothetical protein FJZ61_01835 [Chlamydiae bacterium]|nr:hypothetical protein [Chlamydiota bacterium]
MTFRDKFYLLFFTGVLFSSPETGPTILDQESKQKIYLQEREKIINEAASLFKNKESLKNVMVIVAKWRFRIAKKLNVPKASVFGCLRKHSNVDFYTPFSPYGSDHLYSSGFALVRSGYTTGEIMGFLAADAPFEVFQVVGRLPNAEIPLTKIAYYSGTCNPNLYQFFGFGKNRAFIWVHTHASYLSEIMVYLDTLFQKTLDAKSDEDFFFSLGRFNWWLAHAMPYYRGSAAVAEVLILALLKAEGWNASLSDKYRLDIEALMEPNEEVYAAKYKDFLLLVPSEVV